MVKRRYSNIELASITNDPFYYGAIPTWGKIRLSSKDKFLIDNGGISTQSLDLYLDLLTDNQAYFAWDRQMSEITSRELIFEAGGDSEYDQKACEGIKEIIHSLSSNSTDIDLKSELCVVNNGLGIDGITRGLGLSLITGLGIAEIIWKQDIDRLPTIDSVKIRDIRRFFFEADNSGKTFLKLLTKKNSFSGIYLPPRKFIVNRYWAVPNDDPYGNGLGRLLYYPVTWKRELLSLWLSIIDKYSDPTVVGKYEDGISVEDKEEFERGLSNITRDMAMAMPSHFSVDFVSPTLNGPEILGELEKLCNAYINKIISGEANTGEQGGGGVMRENVSNSIRIMKAKAFSDLISETLNNSLIKWLCGYRYPGANPPRMWRNFGDSVETIEQLTKLKALGFRTTAEFVENLTGIPLEAPQAKKSFG